MNKGDNAMMYANYETFKQSMNDYFRSMEVNEAPSENDYFYRLITVNKANAVRDAIVRVYTENTASRCSAVFYLDDVYNKALKEKLSPKDLISYIDDWFDEAEQNAPVITEEINKVMNNIDFTRIYPSVINTERNAELLKTVPHRTIADLSVVYYYHINSQAKFMITDANMKSLGDMNEETLHRFAIQNGACDAMFSPMLSMITGHRENLLDTEEVENTHDTFVLTFDGDIDRGAGVLACDSILETVYNMMHGSYYIIPSSVHELLIINNNFEPSELRELVKCVNATEVGPQDFLSDNVYYYDGNEVSVA